MNRQQKAMFFELEQLFKSFEAKNIVERLNIIRTYNTQFAKAVDEYLDNADENDHTNDDAFSLTKNISEHISSTTRETKSAFTTWPEKSYKEKLEYIVKLDTIYNAELLEKQEIWIELEPSCIFVGLSQATDEDKDYVINLIKKFCTLHKEELMPQLTQLLVTFIDNVDDYSDILKNDNCTPIGHKEIAQLLLGETVAEARENLKSLKQNDSDNETLIRFYYADDVSNEEEQESVRIKQEKAEQEQAAAQESVRIKQEKDQQNLRQKEEEQRAEKEDGISEITDTIKQLQSFIQNAGINQKGYKNIQPGTDEFLALQDILYLTNKAINLCEQHNLVSQYESSIKEILPQSLDPYLVTHLVISEFKYYYYRTSWSEQAINSCDDYLNKNWATIDLLSKLIDASKKYDVNFDSNNMLKAIYDDGIASHVMNFISDKKCSWYKESQDTALLKEMFLKIVERYTGKKGEDVYEILEPTTVKIAEEFYNFEYKDALDQFKIYTESLDFYSEYLTILKNGKNPTLYEILQKKYFGPEFQKNIIHDLNVAYKYMTDAEKIEFIIKFDIVKNKSWVATWDTHPWELIVSTLLSDKESDKSKIIDFIKPLNILDLYTELTTSLSDLDYGPKFRTISNVMKIFLGTSLSDAITFLNHSFDTNTDDELDALLISVYTNETDFGRELNRIIEECKSCHGHKGLLNQLQENVKELENFINEYAVYNENLNFILDEYVSHLLKNERAELKIIEDSFTPQEKLEMIYLNLNTDNATELHHNLSNAAIDRLNDLIRAQDDILQNDVVDGRRKEIDSHKKHTLEEMQNLVYMSIQLLRETHPELCEQHQDSDIVTSIRLQSDKFKNLTEFLDLMNPNNECYKMLTGEIEPNAWYFAHKSEYEG